MALSCGHSINMAEYFATFYEAMQAIEESRIQYVVGGGIAVWVYGRKRETKDIDVFAKKQDAENILKVLRGIGFRTEHSDEKWLYKAFRGDAMVDVIFENTRGKEIDDLMLKNARFENVENYRFKIMSPEDLIYIKIITIIEDSPHWEDAYIIAKNNYHSIDWEYLLKRSANEPNILLSFLLYTSWGLKTEIVPKTMLHTLTKASGLLEPQPA